MPSATRNGATAGGKTIADLQNEELLASAGQGDLERVRALVAEATSGRHSGFSVNCVDVIGLTPLLKATRQGHVEVARFLLEHGASLDVANNNDHTALACAVIRDDLELAELLLEYGANVEIRIFRRHSPLGYAISRGSVGMVALLLQFGARTDQILYGEATQGALLFSCYFSNVEIVQLLLDHDDGMHINTFCPRTIDDPAMSPLCLACQKNHLEIVQLLIQRGARVIFPGVYPDSPCPLIQAVESHGSLELVRFLLENSPFSVSTNGENTALPGEADGVHPLTMPLASALRDSKLKVAQLLVDHGANDSDGSILWACAAHGWLEGARFLLRPPTATNGADSSRVVCRSNVNRPYYNGQTPLWAAACHGNVALVQEFLKAKADVNIRDIGGETPLGVAHRQGHTGIVYLLLRTSPHVWWRLRGVCC